MKELEDLKIELSAQNLRFQIERDRGIALEKDKASLNIKIRELEASLNTYDLILTKMLNNFTFGR